MDYEKLELEVYELIKSFISQAKFQSASPQSRAYSLEIVQLVAGIKTLKEIEILKAQLKSMSPPEK
jgi:hypothetical protein